MQRLLDTELGKEIRRAEEEHFARQIEKYPHNNIDDIHRIYAVQLGILYYQNFTDQEVESIMRPIFFKISNRATLSAPPDKATIYGACHLNILW